MDRAFDRRHGCLDAIATGRRGQSPRGGAKVHLLHLSRCLTHSSTWTELLVDSPSFYEWRQPRQTAYTLGLLATACLAFCLTPSWLLVKSITLSAGLVFFGLLPIGSRYPDYRLLASPAKWLFWNIPNHGDLAHFKRSISTRP